MPQAQIIGCGGLWTATNDLTKPPNALDDAWNMLVYDKDVLEPRPGLFVNPLYTFSGSNQAAGGLFYYGTKAYALDQYNKKLYRDSGTAWSALSGNYAATSLRSTMYATEYLQNLYFPSLNGTTSGVYMLDSNSGTPYRAGFSRPAPPSRLALVNATGAFGWGGLAAAPTVGSMAAYRCLWGIKDANKRVILGPPSGRTTINNNSSAARYVTGQVPAISESSSSTFYQVYRSKTTQSAEIPASDDLYQVYEGLGSDTQTIAIDEMSKANGGAVVVVTHSGHNIRLNSYIKIDVVNATDRTWFSSGVYQVTAVTAGVSFTYTDTTTNSSGVTKKNIAIQTIIPYSYQFTDYSADNVLQRPLYQNPSDGDGLPNDAPQVCSDIAQWKERVWFANTQDKYRFKMKLVGVEGGGAVSGFGLAAPDSIAISSPALTFVAGTDFSLATGGTPSQNIEGTCRNIVEAINAHPSNTLLDAEYISGDNDTPGEILISHRNYGTAFTVTVNHASAWYPALTTAQASDNEAVPNRVFYSKPRQPESVPALNYIDIGAKDKNILRIVRLREALMVFKEDGIFLITGDYPFRVDAFDTSAILAVPNTLVAGDSAVYGFFNKGFCKITGSGVQILSSPIADYLRLYQSQAPAWGALNEQDGFYYAQMKYLSSDGATDTNVVYVFHTKFGYWTKLDYGGVNSSLATVPGPQCFAVFRKDSDGIERLYCINATGIFSHELKRQYLANPYRWNCGDYIYSTNSNMPFSFERVDQTTAITVGNSGSVYLRRASGSVTLQAGDAVVGFNGAGGSLPNISRSYFDYFADITNAGAGVAFVGLITAISGTPTVYTTTIKVLSGSINGEPGGLEGNCYVAKKFNTHVSYMQSGALLRHYREATLVFHDFACETPTMTCKSDLSQAEEESNIVFSATGTAEYRSKRVLIPKDKQMCNSIEIGIKNAQALCYVKPAGVLLTFEPVSEKGSR